MNADKKRVLIIDDSPDDIQFIMEYLQDDYAVLVGTSGKKGLEIAAKTPKPDVILMDVMMPEMDGYETCHHLKENPETNDIDVIFVSAHDTTEEKLQGYEVGGSDYLIKPVRPEELRQKIKLAINNREERQKVQVEKDMAFSTAMTAMASAGEQGTVLEFLRNSFSINRTEDLAKRIVESVSGFELHNTVQIRVQDKEIYASTSEPVPPLEKELLTRMKDQDRIMSLGNRAIFNYENVSLLIKDMPKDEDKRGRYRGHLAILVEGAGSKSHAILLKEELYKFLDTTNALLSDIQQTNKIHKEDSVKINDQLLQDIESSFTHWGLTEGQEKILMNLVQHGINKSLDHFENGTTIDEQFRTIIDKLSKAAGV